MTTEEKKSFYLYAMHFNTDNSAHSDSGNNCEQIVT